MVIYTHVGVVASFILLSVVVLTLFCIGTVMSVKMILAKKRHDGKDTKNVKGGDKVFYVNNHMHSSLNRREKKKKKV